MVNRLLSCPGRIAAKYFQNCYGTCMLTPILQRLPAPARPLLIPALLFVSLIALAELSRLFTLNNIVISAIWPTSGLFLAALLVWQLKYLPALTLAFFCWCLWLQDYSWPLAITATAGMVLGPLLAMIGLRPLLKSQLTPLKTLSVFYLLAVVVGAGIISAFGSLGMKQFDSRFLSYDLLDVWLTYWAFEALGLLLFTPLLYQWLQDPKVTLQSWRRDLQRPAMQGWLVIAIAAVTIILQLKLLQSGTYANAAIVLTFPLLLWFSLQAEQASVVLLTSVLVTGFIFASLNGLGGLEPISDVKGLIDTVLLAAGLTILGQLVNAMALDRNRLIIRFREQANTDLVTGVASDRRLRDALQEQIKNTGQQGWLLDIRIPDLGPMTDLSSLSQIEQLETLFCERLGQLLPPGHLLARRGAGHYAACLPQDHPNLADWLLNLRQTLEQETFTSSNQSFRLRLLIGGVALDGQLNDAAQYVSAAAQVCVQARTQPQRIALVADTASLVLRQQEHARQFEQLKQALRGNSLELHAQLIAGLQDDDRGHYYEILLRLRGADGQLVSPGAFLPLAEQYGLMTEVDRWVIRTTLQQLASHPDWLAATRYCSINLSGASMNAPDTAAFIRQCLQHTRIDPQRLRFEITETERIDNMPQAQQLVQQLRQLGCSIALDDFGTGLSSFSYLKQFDLDCLKIDGQFIRNIATSQQDQAMVHSMCDVARQLGLTTVAEFVENTDDISLLRQLGVQYAQGYAIARPQPLADLFKQI